MAEADSPPRHKGTKMNINQKVSNLSNSDLQTVTDQLPKRSSGVFRAAAKLMVENGYGGTSIGDIAQAVGMTKTGLDHHISGKQDLLHQILKDAMDELERIVSAPVKSIEDPELRQLMCLQIQGVTRHGLVLVVFFSEINHLRHRLQRYIRSKALSCKRPPAADMWNAVTASVIWLVNNQLPVIRCFVLQVRFRIMGRSVRKRRLACMVLGRGNKLHLLADQFKGTRGWN